MHLPNNQSKVITYRDYRSFDNTRLFTELLCEIKKLNKNISIFHNLCFKVLEKYASEKQTYIRANQANFIDSQLNHTIMFCSNLRNEFVKRSKIIFIILMDFLMF